MLELEQALQNILEGIEPLPGELVPVIYAAGRVLTEALSAPLPLPPFDNSAMDGFAVRAQDTAGASPSQPVTLHMQGAIAAGDNVGAVVSAGTCVRVLTGAPLPQGADAVVMQEDTATDAANPHLVQVREAAKPWENVRFCGEDVKQDEVVCQAGESMTPERLGLLAALGLGRVSVRRQPVLGLLATGSELVEPGQFLSPGKIYESNRTALAALLPRFGAVPIIYPMVPDDAEATRNALERAFSECDAVISTGGVSVGEKDFVKSSFEEIGGELSFWRVAIKPGKPFVFGKRHHKLLFGLPGNPVSTFVTFLLLVRPAILKLQGAMDVGLRHFPGTLREPLTNHGNRRHFMRVFRDAQGNVSLAGAQASHILRSLAHSNGLVDVPPGTVLPQGSPVQVLTWE